jgi:hypothetical protein
MSKDEILQALHILAMGRARHPLHEQLAEKLAGLIHEAELAAADRKMSQEIAAFKVFEANQAEAPKRTRKAKAE